MKQFLDELGRHCEVINLDFANDRVPYEVSVDVRDLIDLESVMEELNLGPNGGLVYCMVSYFFRYIETVAFVCFNTHLSLKPDIVSLLL